jgi:hypothetical protein
MNPSIKQEWLAALRSGQYKQGKHRLQNSAGGFCCLGVLCDIASRHGVGRWESDWRKLPEHLGDLPVYCGDIQGSPDAAEGHLPQAVMEWAGLDTRTVYLGGGDALTALNDHGLTFAEIADLIDKKL